MKVVLASTSAVKLEACRKAFPDAEIVTVKAASGVPEQPVMSETVSGAFNRINAAKAAAPGADLYVSIENGLFREGESWTDRAVVAAAGPGDREPLVGWSEPVEFPAAAVNEARQRGFSTWTVGKVMAEKGIVRQHDDPHLDLSGKSRAAYIDDALADVKRAWNGRKNPGDLRL